MLELLAHPSSSYSQKVLIALYENATPFQFRIFGTYVMTPTQRIVDNSLCPPEDRHEPAVTRAKAILDQAHSWLEQRGPIDSCSHSARRIAIDSTTRSPL